VAGFGLSCCANNQHVTVNRQLRPLDQAPRVSHDQAGIDRTQAGVERLLRWQARPCYTVRKYESAGSSGMLRHATLNTTQGFYIADVDCVDRSDEGS